MITFLFSISNNNIKSSKFYINIQKTDFAKKTQLSQFEKHIITNYN